MMGIYFSKGHKMVS